MNTDYQFFEFTGTMPGMSPKLEVVNGVIANVMMGRNISECQLTQIVRVEVKAAPLKGGDEIQFRIVYNNGGKEKNFNWIHARLNDHTTKSCFDYLKSAIPSHAEWKDMRTTSISSDGRKAYNIQYDPWYARLMGESVVNLNRGLSLWLHLIFLFPTIVPLFYHLPIIIKGGYRIYTDENEVEFRWWSSKKYNWNELSNVEWRQIKIKGDSYVDYLLEFHVQTSKGDSFKLVLTLANSKQFMRDLADHGIIDQSVVEQFV
jgi:hypothetical protein